MEALIGALQTEDLELRDRRVCADIHTLLARLSTKGHLSADQEAFLAATVHAFICKTASGLGGNPLVRSVHVSVVAFALTALERRVKADTFVSEAPSPSPLTFLELLEAATIKEKAEEQRARTQAGISRYADEQPVFGDEKRSPTEEDISVASPPEHPGGSSLAAVLRPAVQSGAAFPNNNWGSRFQTESGLPLAKDLPSVTLYNALLHQQLVTRILALCDALLQPLTTLHLPKTWPAVHRHLSLASQLMLYLEEILLLQAPVHTASEVEPWLHRIASHLGPVYGTLLETSQTSDGAGDAGGEAGPGELLLVNEILGVAETARVNPTVLVNLKAMIAATLVDTIGQLQVPDLDSLLEPGSTFSDAHESLPHSGEEQLGVTGNASELGPSLVSLALQLIQEVDQELAPYEIRPGASQRGDTGTSLLSGSSDIESLARSGPLNPTLKDFDWRKSHSREHLLSLILPRAGKWLDILVAMLLVNTDQEKLGAGDGIDASGEGFVDDGGLALSTSPSKKSGPPSKEDNLFGDLFQEAAGGRGVSEVSHREVPLELHSHAREVSMGGWAEAAALVVQFLKACAFDDCWCPAILEASCSLLRKNHLAAIVKACVAAGGDEARGSNALGSALYGLAETLTLQDERTAETPGLVEELAVQLYTQGAQADGLLAVLAKWLLRKKEDLEGQAARIGSSAPDAAGALPENRGAQPMKGGASAGASLRTLVTTVWEVFFQTAGTLAGSADAGQHFLLQGDADSPLEQALSSLPNQGQMSVLLLGFHLLEPGEREDLLRATMGHLERAVHSWSVTQASVEGTRQGGESNLGAVQQLAVSRLVLLTGSMVSHQHNFPVWLPGQLQTLLDPASSHPSDSSSVADPLSLSASLAQQIGAANSGPVAAEFLARSLFLLGKADELSDMGSNEKAQPPPETTSSFLRSLLTILVSPCHVFESCAELFIARYLSEVCWRHLWLFPLPTPSGDDPQAEVLCIAQLLQGAGLAPVRDAALTSDPAPLLSTAWSAVGAADLSFHGGKSNSLVFGMLVVVQAGLQALQEEKGGEAKGALWSRGFGTWLQSKGPGPLLLDLCSMLDKASSRYTALLQSHLEGSYGPEAAQLVLVLLRARLNDRTKFEGALGKAGVSVSAVQSILQGAGRLLESLPLGSQQNGNGVSASLIPEGAGVNALRQWEAALVLPGLPSTPDISSAPVASSQMLIRLVLGCLGTLLSVEDCGKTEWSVLERALSRATLTGLVESEGALVNRIWTMHPSLDVEKQAIRELDHGVSLCQDLLQQREAGLSTEPEPASKHVARPPPLGKHVDMVLEVVLLDTAHKLEALLDEPTGWGLRILLHYFSDKPGTEPFLEEASSSSQAAGEPRRSDASRNGRELRAGDPEFFLRALSGNASSMVNQRLLNLATKMLSPQKEAAASGSSDSKLGTDVASLREELAAIVGQRLRAGLLGMGEPGLATWLEERLLGNAGGALVWNAPAQQRESTAQLLETLVRDNRGTVSDFHSQVLTALLARLKPAYTTFEAKNVAAYFEFIVHLAADHPSLIQRTLEVVLELLDTFALKAESISTEQLGHVQGLLGFLAAVLISVSAAPPSQPAGSAPVAQEALFRPGRTGHYEQRERSVSRNRAPQMHEAIVESREEGRDDGDRDEIEDEEEEEDLISFGEGDEEEEVFEGDDGETVEMDDDDGFSAESSSDDDDSKLCTFGASGSNFIEQHWYFCYTCDLVVSKGCCSTCARVCHKDHKVVYSKFSRFFCDCGAGGSRTNSCQALKPRGPRSDTSSSFRADRASAPGPISGENASDSGSEAWFDPHGVLPSEAFPKLRVDAGVLAVLEEKGLERVLLKLCDSFADALGLGHSGLGEVEEEPAFDFSLDGGVTTRNDIATFTRGHKYGTFETKLKMEYSSAREVKAALATGAISKSLLSVSKRGKVAIGEGDKVSVFEAAVLTAAAADKGTQKPLSKNSVRFQVLSVEFNPANEAHLVVSGYEDCQVFILNFRGEVTDRLAVELALEPETFVVQAGWVPGSQVELMVVTNRMVKIYDLSKDKISPVFYVTIPQESIKQVVLGRDAANYLCAVVLTQQGVLFTGQLSPPGAINLTERLQLPFDRQWPGSRGCSLSYFPDQRTLVSSYEDGQVAIGRLADSFKSFEKVCFLSESERPGNLHFWRAVSEGRGIYVAASSTRQGAAVAVQLATGSVGTQPLRQVGGSASLRMEGVGTYIPAGAGQKSTILVLNDDGSLHVFSYAPAERGLSSRMLRSTSTSGKAISVEKQSTPATVSSPSFPLTFFENTTCITQNVTWGGDLEDSDAIKLSLAAEESFLEAPSIRPFKIVVNSSAADTVMVGCRVHLGATGRTNVPSWVQVFDRPVNLEEGTRRWYDIPFTVVESLTADKSFTLTVGPASNNQLSRIDVIEVYGRSKEDFGWREKAESMRDLLQQNRGGSSGFACAPPEASVTTPVTPVEESLCAGLEVLGHFYGRATVDVASSASKPIFSARPSGQDHFEDAVEEQADTLEDVLPPPSDRPTNLSPKCLPLLEKAFFASEPHPTIQSFAQRVLNSLYPGSDEAQSAKDALLMDAFAKSVGTCAETISQGGSHARPRVARLFSQRMHWASEIAAQRFEHFREAVARQGGGLVDDLVRAFEAVVAKESLEGSELSALTVDFVEVLCGCGQQVLAEKEADLGGGLESSETGGRPTDLGGARLKSSETGLIVAATDKAIPNQTAGLSGGPQKEVQEQGSGLSQEQRQTIAGLPQAEHIVQILRGLLVSPQEPVRSAVSIALSAHVLQSKLATTTTPLQPLGEGAPPQEQDRAPRATTAVIEGVQYSCDGCGVCPIRGRRWHCTQCPDFDLCKRCYEAQEDRQFEQHLPEHQMVCLPIDEPFAASPALIDPRSVAEASSLPLSDDESDGTPETLASNPIGAAGNQTTDDASPLQAGGAAGDGLAVEDISEEEHLRLALELSLQEQRSQNGAINPGGGVDPESSRGIGEASATEEKGEGRQASPEGGSGSAAGAPIGAERQVDSRAGFRKMLLANLVEDVGWMRRCSGLEAIPVFQLLARLASERSPGGMIGLEGFDIRGLVEAMLRELNLGVQLPIDSKSGWGEVAVLTLKFFAFVLTDWEGTDKEATMVGAAGHTKKSRSVAGPSKTGPKEALLQQALLSYLLSILQRLVPEFAKPKREKSGCPGHDQQGALLHLRHEKSMSSLQPFFPDSYTRIHGRNVFSEYPKLLLGAALDLAQALTESGLKISGSVQGEGEKAPEGAWVDILCSYIYCQQTHFVRDSARHVLLQACGGDKARYNLARDSWLLGKEIQQLQRLADKSDGFQHPLSHDKSVKLVKCLGVLAETAEKRPRSWQWFCSPGRDPDALGFLLRVAYSIGEEAALQALKLLALALAERKEESAQASTRPLVDFVLKDPSELERFVHFFLLDFSAKAVRAQARALLQNAWLRADQEGQRVALLRTLVEAIPQLSSYGANVHELSGLLKWILGKGAELQPESWTAALARSGLSSQVLKALRTHNQLLETHPNGQAYQTLQSLIEFDGFYLESEPCTACNSVEVPYSKLKLESIKQETKYTENRILVRCPCSYTVESFVMNVHDARRSKSVKVLRLYYNNRAASDLSELKGNWGLWKKVKSYHLAPNQAELKADLTVPVTGCNFMFEFAELYENLQASSLEHLQCPRCSRHVTDRHGICPHCHENCFQCRQCRNINYENLDSFLCNECGYSKYGRFEFSVNAKPSFAFDAIESEDDMQKCQAVIEKESENAHKQYQQLLATKKPLLRLISTVGEGLGDQDTTQVAHQVAAPSSSTSATLKVNQTVAVLGVLYGNKCKEAFEQVSRSVQALDGARKALTAYLERGSSGAGTVLSKAPRRPPSRCYGCASTFVGHALEWLTLLANSFEEKQKMVDQGLVEELFESGVHHGLQQIRTSSGALICTLVQDNPAASATLTALIRHRLTYCLDHPRTTELALQAKNDCQLLRDACALNDSCWEPHLKLAFEILFRGVEVGTDKPPIAENIVLPCLRIVAQACQVPSVGPVTGEGNSSRSTDTVLRQTSPPIGGLSRAFSSLGGVGAGGAGGAGERRSFAQVASGAARQEGGQGTRGTQAVASSSPQPSRPPPTRPAPLVVTSQPRLERNGKDGAVVTYKEWSNGTGSFETFTERQKLESLPETQPPQAIPPSPLRGSSASMKIGVLRSQKESLTRRVVSKWKGARARRQLGVLDRDSWLKGLVLSAGSPTIRTEACALVRTLSASGSPGRSLRLLDLMTELLTIARDARAEAVVDYFDLYKDMLADEDGRLYLTAKGWLRNACGLIVSEVHRIRAQEGDYRMANVNEGFVLQHLIGFLRSFLEMETVKQRFVRDGLLTSLLEALLSLKSLVIQKTKLTTSCAQELSSLLEKLLETGEDTQRSFVRACMSALEGHTGKKADDWGGQRAATFIMDQLCDVIQPVRPEPVYLLTLNKAHTQEEFIRGSMAQNPYSSADIGPLMRDVKNKICTQLEMLGLIEDDFGMELLVAGSIVSLDLSIKQVYEKVWLRTQQAVGVQSLSDCPPMSVTYRLQGLDGEATEPMISEVDDDRGEQQDPEIEFALTGEMETCGGLELLLRILRGNPRGRGELGALLKLLGFCCKVRTNRRTLLRLDALQVLLDRARAAVSLSTSEPDGTAEALLEIIESLVTEANDMAAGGLEHTGGVTPKSADSASVTTPRRSWAGEAREEEAVAAVKMFLDKLLYRPPPVQGGRNAPDTRGGKQKDGKSPADAVARILPYLTYGEPAAMECLIGHFAPFMDFQEFDRLCMEQGEGKEPEESARGRALDHQQRLESFVKVCESIRLDSNGALLKTLFLERGLVARTLHYLRGTFPPVASAGAVALEIRSSPEFTKALLLPSVPFVLGILTGLANGHGPIQGLMEKEGVLPLLHALEGVSSEQKEIRAKAEGVLDIVSDEASGGTLSASVKSLRQATKDELRVRAMKRREAMLRGLGMASAVTSDGADRIVVSAKPKIEGLDEMEEEEDGFSCMVCREGYKLKPAECLGTYTFSKRVNGGGMPGARSEHFYTTVSHFNVIHFTCHQEAKRADSKLKTPKKEWEGATLRNSETLANSIFPLRGSDVPLQSYSRYCDQYWENLASLGRAEGSRFKLLAHDLGSLLGRFASGGSFSVDSHGGSKESNSQLLPFMVQMGAYLLEQVGSSQRRALRKSLQSYLGVAEASRTPGAATPQSSSRRSSFVDGASTTPTSSTPDLASTPTSSSLPPRSPAPAVARSLDESIHLMLVLSLLLHSLKEWQKHRREFLARGIHFAYNQTRENRPLMPVPPSPSPGASLTDLSSLFTGGPLVVQTQTGAFDPRATFKAVKPIAILVALMDKLQVFFKKGGPGAKSIEQDLTASSEARSGKTPDEEELSFSFSRGPSTPRTPEASIGEASALRRGGEVGAQKNPSRRPSTEDLGDQSWELVMKEKLNDIPAMLAFAKEFQELVEDLHAAEDLMELLDIVDCLGDIYDQSGKGSWEEFLEQTVTGSTPRASGVS